MAKVSACPDGAQLRQLLAGLLADEQAASLEEHLAGCSCCSELVESMVGEESLAHAVRSGMASLSEVDHPLVQNVIERLSKLPVGLVPVEHTAAVQTNDTETLSLSSMRAEQVHGLSDEDLEILAPPHGPNEMGRLGGYRILRVLGQGGMGIVYQAEDVQLRRLVALKVMRPKLANPSARERFLHEARACAALKHDHIVSIYQVGQDRGVPFLAMEFLEGRSLDRCLEPDRPLTLPQVLRIGKELAQGLAAAHAKGLIHRDIKPANIWLDTDSGRVKILDFGLARSQTDDVQLTASNTIVGTPSYMAPEQARGETVDGRCDLFSLGCVLYRLSTGKLPFAGNSTMAILLELATHTPRPVKEVNPEMPLALSQLIERLLAKDPKDRPSSAAQVVQALQQIEDDSPRNAPAPLVGKPRRGLLIAGVVGAVLTAIVLVGVVLYRYLDGEPRQAAATGNGEGPRGAADSGSPPLTTASKPGPNRQLARRRSLSPFRLEPVPSTRSGTRTSPRMSWPRRAAAIPCKRHRSWSPSCGRRPCSITSIPISALT
jgi:serine/threonine protein kinase